MGKVTLQTIADRVGVSRMTVSNAFARPDQLSGALRSEILEVAAELGYVGPDPTARALSSGRAGAIGVLLTDTLGEALTDQVAMIFLGAIADGLASSGLAMTLLSATERGGTVQSRDVPVDGALVYSCKTDSAAVDWLTRRRLPMVFVDQTPVDGIPSVNVDDRAGARAAAQHLVELGHRRIGIVTMSDYRPHGRLSGMAPPTAAHTERQRLLGWSDALTAADIEPIVIRQPYDDPPAVQGRRAGAELIRAGVTAILCFSDAIALGVLDAARDAGIAVPQDLSVVGFDDNPLAARSVPALTTVRQDVAAKGELATAELLGAIELARAGGTAPVRHIELPTQLVLRDSTAPPPSGSAAAVPRSRTRGAIPGPAQRTVTMGG